MPVPAEAVADLARSMTGEAYSRGDPALAIEAACFNTAVRHDPDVLVAVRTLEDVVAAVRFAGRFGLPVFVQATGHGAFAPVIEGMLVSTRHLDAVEVDASARVAVIAAGAPWGVVVEAAGRFGLMPPPASCASVGAVGYTLGGGLGPLARTFGFTSDWVRSFVVVTADARGLTADERTNADLYRALRGGKAGLGIVVAMELELVPLVSVYGGGLFWASEHVEPALRAWAAWSAGMPDAVTSSVAILRFPPIDEVPELLRGRVGLHLRYAFVGDEEIGERLLAPMREAAPVAIDLVGIMPAADVSAIHDDPDRPGPAWDRGMLLDEIDDEFVTRLLAVAGPARDIPFVAVEIRHIGGATVDAPDEDAVGGRGGAYTFVLVGVPVPELFNDLLPRASDLVVAAIRPWIAAETNINFLGHVASTQSWSSAWPQDAYRRLAAARASYDPEGRFPTHP